MAKILTKNSFTTGSAPSGLSAGELAVNVVDKKIFVGNAVGGVVTLYDQNGLVASVNGITGGVTLAAGTGVGLSTSSKTITVSNTGVLSVNGATGVIGSIAVTNASQSFAGLQKMPSGISASGIINVGDLTVSGTNTNLNSPTTTVTNSSARLTVSCSLTPGTPGTLRLTSDDGDVSTFSSDLVAPSPLLSNTTNILPSTSGTLLNSTTPYVSSVNGATGAVFIGAGTAISLSAAGKGITVTNSGVHSINGLTGAVTNINAATVTVTSSNLNATRYLTFAYGAGDTGIFIDPTTTPLTYNPAGGAIGAKKLTLTTGPNVITVDSASPNMTLSDGTDIASFGPYQFSHNGTLPFDVSSNIAVAIGGPEIQFYGGWGAYYFPTSNGTTGQALFTNGDGILYWGTVSSGGGGSATGFTYAASAPGTPTVGDRWIDSDTGKEYVYVNDGTSSQWIEPMSSNGLSGVTYTSATRFLEFGVTGSFVKLGVNNTSPQYTLDVNGVINTPVGISAGPITSSGATFSGAVVSDGGYRITSSAINAQTGTTYTLLTSDNGKIITMSNGSAITLTVPAGLPIGYNTTVIQLGAGQVGITASSTTLNSFEGKLKLAGQHAAASIISYTTNVFNVAGGLTA